MIGKDQYTHWSKGKVSGLDGWLHCRQDHRRVSSSVA